jgi:AcrR family transcriptional regulator
MSKREDSPRRVARRAQRGAREAARQTTRRRRAPDVARQELLDAAERVFIEFAPEQVGLKDVAREAGVSHALITHYFGTYAGLVEATLERRLTSLRETVMARLADASVLARPTELLAILFRAFEDPVHLRLMKWMVASERAGALHALALQHHGLQLVAQQVAHAVRPPKPSPETIATIELALMTSVAAALGYAISKYALAGAAGRQVSGALDNQVQETLAGMLRSYFLSELGPPPPGLQIR